MSEKLKLFGHAYNQVGDVGTDFVIKTRGLVKVQWGRKFIDIVKDGKLNVNVDFIRRVPTKDDIGTVDGLYVTDAGEVYLVSGGITIALFGEAGTTYVAYVGDLDTTLEAKLLALKNIGIVFPTIAEAAAIITEGFVYILEDKTFYTVENGVFTPYPPNEDSDVLILDKRIITILNSGNQVINIQDGIITIDAPIISNEHILSPTFISNIFKSEGGTAEKGFLVETKGGISTLYVDYLVVRKKSGEDGENEIPYLVGNTQYSYKRNYIINFDETTKTFSLAFPQQYKKDDVLRIYTQLKVTEKRTDPDNPSLDPITITYYKDIAIDFVVDSDSDEEGKTIKVGNPIIDGTEIDITIPDHNDSSTGPSNTEKELLELLQSISFEGREVFLVQEEDEITRRSDGYNIDLIDLKKEDKSVIHTRLGGIADFRTYTEKDWIQGLFSDLPVFNGGEFREPIPPDEEESPSEESEEEEEIEDLEVQNFPRYSQNLNDVLCTHHVEVEDGTEFDNVIPTIRWIKLNALNTPLKEINAAELGDPPEPELDDEGNEIPVAIVHNSEGWQYMKVVPWDVFKKCCDEVKGLLQKFTVSWYIGEDTLYTTTTVNANTSATSPSTNPTKKHWKFLGWDYDDSPVTEDTSIYAKWEYIPPKVYISVSPAYLTNLGGSATVSYYVEWDGEIITEGITVEGTYSNIDYEEDGGAYILDNKVNRDLIIKESTFSVLGKIYFLAKFMGEEGDEEGMGEVTAETVLQQRPAGALALPDFDLMKFSAEWTNTTTDDMTDVEGWTKQSDGVTWRFKSTGDLDVLTHTENTNIPITETKTLDDYGVGFVGDKNMSQYIDSGSSSRTIEDTESPYSTVSSRVTLITRKDYTKVFDSDYNEVTLDTIELFNANHEKDLNSGKDIYNLYQYLAWSGDNTSSGGEYTVLNFKKIINNTVRSGQKAIFIYMLFIWAMTYNGTGNFNIAYNIYKLNNEEKGLISPKDIYDFSPEDSSVELIEVTNNKLTGLHLDKLNTSFLKRDYSDPVATLYYDLATQEITFIQGYYTEEDIYGKSTSASTFIWTDAESEE